MSSAAKVLRQKISTTISPSTLAYLQRRIDGGGARNLAEAIDQAIEQLLLLENRERLERDTAAYFDNMSPEENAEEQRLSAALAHAARGIDFDREP